MLPELEYYDTNIPCLAACPVHTNAGMYVAAIADGDDELAYLTARLPNPFASVCGRVCAAPCEDACRRGEIDRPIAIRALKRFVTEQFGPEHGDTAAWQRVIAPPEVERPEKVAIVGGGPAGMACAHDLRRHGYQVTVYEATDKLGGAMWLGIPEYRLDRDVLQADIDSILALGVDVHYDTRLGRRRHPRPVARRLRRGVPRHRRDARSRARHRGFGDADGVFKAIEFLINMNRGFSVDVGERVVVIGGGDVAMDAARTALRASEYEANAEVEAATDDDEAAEQRSAMTEAIDVARTAHRAGARAITVMSLESREEMPAHDFEVEEAEHEGIEFVPRRGPVGIKVEDGRVTGVETDRRHVGVRRRGAVRPRVRRHRPAGARGRHRDPRDRPGDRSRGARRQRPGNEPPSHDPDRLGHRAHLRCPHLVGRRRREGAAHPDRRGRRRPSLGRRHPPGVRR